MLELLASLILWTGIDQDAKLQVTCAAVTLDIGLESRARPEPVAFWFKDLQFDHTWLYVIPMELDSKGRIILEPTGFWIEEIRQQKELVVRVDNKYYTFDLKGTKDLIDCDGVVVK